MAAGPASRLGSQSPGIKQGRGSHHTLHLAQLKPLQFSLDAAAATGVASPPVGTATTTGASNRPCEGA